MIIRSSVGKPFLNSKTLSELCKPSYSLHNAHSKPKIGESVNFEITLKLNTSVSELQTLRKPAQNKSTQHTKWNKRVKFENRSHNALWSCIFSEVQKLVDVSLPNSKWKQRVRVLNQNMLAKHGWFLTKNKQNATARVFFAKQFEFRLLWGETNSEPFGSFHDESGAVQADSIRISVLVQKHLFSFLSRWVVVYKLF